MSLVMISRLTRLTVDPSGEWIAEVGEKESMILLSGNTIQHAERITHPGMSLHVEFCRRVAFSSDECYHIIMETADRASTESQFTTF